MADAVKGPRRYVSAVRAEQAAATRAAVLRAARELFTERGYAATSIAAIAERAGVAVDTVYAAAGRKPQLLRELVETSLSGSDHAVPALQRDYVARVRAAGSAREMLRIHAVAVGEIGERLAPVHAALAEAAVGDRDCAALRAEIDARRAANMRLLAADLRATGELRPDLTDDEVADILWSTNAAEYRALLVGARGWSSERFRDWLEDAWGRLLLREPGQR
ncbi:helix-turn-helix domain-containing protein [Blastococcus sp. CCUG 61487]|uniref:TetR/AcrR family transcriptional regulator n=1 Tax=Blastococcus sp. CCUG 61487 TaxID=1840703 RepID=UPI0010C0EBFC|nr:helix-turn-helix domain-containing protein [Blastococcus sp. CCUG 61487]TKJ16815.1 TetR family transcriptional regulator [Blastococcus sp. CCUG 61487]